MKKMEMCQFTRVAIPSLNLSFGLIISWVAEGIHPRPIRVPRGLRDPSNPSREKIHF